MAFKKKVIEETPITDTEISQTSQTKQAVLDTSKTMAQIAKEAEKRARKLRKVTVHYNSPIDSHLVTSAYAVCSNQYFTLGKIVPLDITVELEQGLCDNLAEALIQVMIPDGQGQGNMKSVMRKKYSVIYED